ncbi:MAG TPA: MATE family efflux transporter [Kineosporiaceae bacterium]|nr:MATE family efflux transporter [Kineosporiaceae bacterium]
MTVDSAPVRTDAHAVLALAVPALGALVAEPLFLLADSAIVGRLGTVPLAGLGVAAGLLTAAVSTFVFLAYGTTAAVARRMGAGERTAALRHGVDGLWLALILGIALAAAAVPAAPWAVAAFSPPPDVAEQAVIYLRWALPGVPAMLVVLAATGVLRGLLDTRTPLVVATVGAVLNALLNLVLVHGAQLGIAGSAIGTATTQLLMAVAVGAVVVRGARAAGAPLRPDLPGIRGAARHGVGLLIRTLALRVAILVTTWAAASAGVVQLAAHQVVATVWGLLALALDAVAIAAQALTGAALGAGDVHGVRTATARMVRWGVAAAAVLGLLSGLAAPVLAPAFSADPAVRAAIVSGLAVVGVLLPLGGYVFVLDGVLIGAGDGTYLAVGGVVQTALYAPLALLIGWFGPPGTARLVLLWISFAGGWMLLRALFLGLRARSAAWLVTGAVRSSGDRAIGRRSARGQLDGLRRRKPDQHHPVGDDRAGDIGAGQEQAGPPIPDEAPPHRPGDDDCEPEVLLDQQQTESAGDGEPAAALQQAQAQPGRGRELSFAPGHAGCRRLGQPATTLSATFACTSGCRRTSTL